MKNGTYLVKHKALQQPIKATFFSGRVSYKNSLGKVIRDNAERFMEHYEVIRPVKSEQQLYDLVLMAHGQVKEVLARRKPYGLCVTLRDSHKGGGLPVIKPCE